MRQQCLLRFGLALALTLLAAGFAHGDNGAGAAQPGAGEPAIPPWDHVVPAWYQGMPVMMRAFELDPGGGYMRESQVPPPDSLPWQQVVSYITGIVDPAIGASPAQRLPGPPGGSGSPRTMPPHQGVLPCLGRPDAPFLGVSYSVIPGPEANHHNLRADPEPPGSVIGAPLATEIRIGPSWVPLTHHRAIDYGLHRGILRLRFFGANPVLWLTPEWENNYPPVPELYEDCTQPARAPGHFLSPGDAAPIPAH